MMSKLIFSLALALVVALVLPAAAGESNSPLNYKMKSLDGKPVDLSQYKGKVVLIVNVASYCGNTKQYKGLEEVYKKYKDQGLTVLGFPANEFGKQEPGTDQEIAEFCKTKYSVDFPMFSKIVVKGEGINPLYLTLTSPEANPKFAGPITWNFEKFPIGRDGKVAARIASRTPPESEEVVGAIQSELAKK